MTTEEKALVLVNAKDRLGLIAAAAMLALAARGYKIERIEQ